VLAPWAKLQAMLQGAEPVGYYYSAYRGVLLNASSRRAGPRLRHFVPESSFLDRRSWRSRSWALRVLGALGTLGALGAEPPACRELWLAGCFKGCFVRGSEREVEDILLSEMTAGVRAKVTGCAFCAKRSEREQGREMAKRKYRF